MAVHLYNLPRPVEYDMACPNNKGFIFEMEEMAKLDECPSLASFILQESWLVFNILGHSNALCKWMLFPASSWNRDKNFQQFKTFVKNLAVVNDNSKQAVKLVQETICQVMLEQKLHNVLQVKNKICDSRLGQRRYQIQKT